MTNGLGSVKNDNLHTNVHTHTFSLCRCPSNSLSEDSPMEKIRLGIRVQMKITPQSYTSALREREVKWGCSETEVGVMCMAHKEEYTAVVKLLLLTLT